jgi:glutamine amidotransferase
VKAVATIVDYGMGNLLSVCRAIEHCGAIPRLTSSPADIEGAERLILPGVGAFEDGMNGLRERQLVEPVRAYCASGRPFLGICLGMQMMMETSEEFGHHSGLGLIAGTVVEIPRVSDGATRKIPHIGWNTLRMTGVPWEGTILTGLAPGAAAVYFVHSYAVRPADSTHVLAECSYDGHPIVAALRNDMMYGCQFHPEKSGQAGLQIIRQYCQL